MNIPDGRRFDRKCVSSKLERPAGFAGAAQFFETQPSNLQPDIALLNITEAAEFLTISVSSMRRLQQGRRIAFFKVGGSIRFAKQSLVTYLMRQRVDLLGQE